MGYILDDAAKKVKRAFGKGLLLMRPYSACAENKKTEEIL
jgi:hypothetical protein